MIKKGLLLLLLLAVLVISLYLLLPGTKSFPVKEWIASSHDRPMVFYITGDGGVNDFSTGLCSALHRKGYDVCALDARSYFWHRKTPAQATDDINRFVTAKLAGRDNIELIFIGYSFGADVLPFILNTLPVNTQERIWATVIIGSSGSTDFEIHWADLVGKTTVGKMEVVPEINKLRQQKIVIIDSKGDSSLSVGKIVLKKYIHVVLQGGHHFGGKTDSLANVILKHIK
jgi:type IV secretory pathway VirJ component